MIDQIASLIQRGLISPDAAQNMMQQVNYWQNKGIQPPLLEQGGAGTRIGATTTKEPLLGYSYGPKKSANQNSAIERPIENKSSTSQPSINRSTRLPPGYEVHQGEDPVTGEYGWHVTSPSEWIEHSAPTREEAISGWLKINPWKTNK